MWKQFYYNINHIVFVIDLKKIPVETRITAAMTLFKSIHQIIIMKKQLLLLLEMFSFPQAKKLFISSSFFNVPFQLHFYSLRQNMQLYSLMQLHS